MGWRTSPVTGLPAEHLLRGNVCGGVLTLLAHIGEGLSDVNVNVNVGVGVGVGVGLGLDVGDLPGKDSSADRRWCIMVRWPLHEQKGSVLLLYMHEKL
jgi:hypothetical protein